MSCLVMQVREATEARGWRHDPVGVRPLQPSGHAAGRPRSGFNPRTRRFPAPGHPSRPASARAQLPLAPPRPPLPLTSHDVQGEGHQEAEPGAAGPPGSRCRAPRHPGAHPSHGRRGLGGRLRWPQSAGHLLRQLRAGPTQATGSPMVRPPRGRSSQTMERELEQEGGRERTRHTGCPPPHRVLVPYGSGAPERPRARGQEECRFPGD